MLLQCIFIKKGKVVGRHLCQNELEIFYKNAWWSLLSIDQN